MSEVNPDFRGMAYGLWRTLHLKEDAEKFLKTKAGTEAPLSKKREWTPRDDYGMKGV